MKRTLLVLTTANQLNFTKRAIASLEKANPPGLDLLVIDDHSVDGTVAYCKKKRIEVFTKEHPKGVTHSWNIGYKHFKKYAYDYLIYANNDILIPKGSIERLLMVLEEQSITGVLSTRNGVPFDSVQSLSFNFDLSKWNFDIALPENYQKVQDMLLKLNMQQDYKYVIKVNGFFFGVSRKICDYEIGEDVLFNPRLINVENEYELCRRVKTNIAVSMKSFIFHYKGVSFRDHDIDPNYDYGRQLTWQEAIKLRKSKWRRFLFRIKAKLK